MFQIENEYLAVEVVARGAELSAVRGKSTGKDYLWDGNPAFWGKKSPILFPIVGTLRGNKYYYQGREYHLSRHGFARDLDFLPVGSGADFLVLQLDHSAETLSNYPFPFRLQVGYRLAGRTLEVSYTVINPSSGDLYFSIGGHPAFRVPLSAGRSYSDYQLEFELAEEAVRWPITREGLIESQPVPLLANQRILALTHTLFYQDALVCKQLRSRYLTLGSRDGADRIRLDFTGFPYLGIWAARDADFVCIEPWCGIADSVNASQDITGKEGIICLEGGGRFERSWSVTFD
ncbi:MAG TPA: aldose 1-epimerase family protein [Chitinophagaceae bacterium]|nr:aldose 1-epimerase family protein [Chitinophagaceae bacterium]